MCYCPYDLRIFIGLFHYVSSFPILIIMALFVLSPSHSQYLIDVVYNIFLPIFVLCVPYYFSMFPRYDGPNACLKIVEYV